MHEPGRRKKQQQLQEIGQMVSLEQVPIKGMTVDENVK
jgi:hypothetical protein